MAMSSHAQGIRRGVLASASVAVVYAVSHGGAVNWIVSLSGTSAWLFVLLANVYFAGSWYVERNLIKPDTDQHHDRFFYKRGIVHRNQKNAQGADKYFGGMVDGDDARQWMARTFTDGVSFVGCIVSVLGFWFALNS